MDEQVESDSDTPEEVERTADHAGGGAGDHAAQLGAADERVHVHPLHHRVDVDAPQQLVEVDPPDGRVEVDPPDHSVDIDAGDESVDVDPLEHPVEVDSGDEGVDVDPLEHAVEVDAGQELVDVDPVDQRLHVDALQDLVEIDAIDDRPDVHAPDDLVDVDRIDNARCHVARHRAHDPARAVEDAADQAPPRPTGRARLARSVIHAISVLDLPSLAGDPTVALSTGRRTDRRSGSPTVGHCDMPALEGPRAGFHAVTPRLVVSDVAAQVEFLRAVFDALASSSRGARPRFTSATR